MPGMNPRTNNLVLAAAVMLAAAAMCAAATAVAAAPVAPAGMAIIAAGEHRPLFVPPNEPQTVPVAAQFRGRMPATGVQRNPWAEQQCSRAGQDRLEAYPTWPIGHRIENPGASFRLKTDGVNFIGLV